MDMTPEEKERSDRIDRQLEFLAAHQARLSSDLATLQLITAQLIEKSAKHDEQIARQGSQIQSLADTVLRLARIVDERDRQTDAKIDERDRQTNARINALINIVERYFSDGKH